jgi:hypothetical protein
MCVGSAILICDSLRESPALQSAIPKQDRHSG